MYKFKAVLGPEVDTFIVSYNTQAITGKPKNDADQKMTSMVVLN